MAKRWSAILGLGAACSMASAMAQTQPHTLQESLIAAYMTNPTLLAARAALRSVDEGVPQALAGWRPTVTVTSAYGVQNGSFSSIASRSSSGSISDGKPSYQVQATVTQPLYRGGRTEANTHGAENRVLSQRGRLIATEQLVFTNVITDYVNVIQTEQLLQLDINNEQVLTRQLQATNDRFRVGEITRTDVAQAEAALAGRAVHPADRRRQRCRPPAPPTSGTWDSCPTTWRCRSRSPLPIKSSRRTRPASRGPTTRR